MHLQDKIDELSYPCTHQYKLDGLEPIGHLKKRLELIPKEFWLGCRFLDIGCNKGYFSHISKCGYKKAIDSDPKYVELCKEMGLDAELSTFRDYTTSLQFDRIMLGNVMHYLYRDACGWDFIEKLAVISEDLILIEAPTGLECEDLKGFFPKHLKQAYTFENFMSRMNLYFDLMYKVDSPSPDRYIMMFKRKPVQKLQLDQVLPTKILKTDDNSTVYLTIINDKKYIVKLYRHADRHLRNRIKMASLSPISNGILYEVYDGIVFMGWVEEIIEDDLYEYKENQIDLFMLICTHNIFLARNGYCDIDTATINFFKNNKLVDKGGVKPIKDINDKDVNDYFIQLNNSYDMINEIIQGGLYQALLSKDSKKIEEIHGEIYGHYV